MKETNGYSTLRSAANKCRWPVLDSPIQLPFPALPPLPLFPSLSLLPLAFSRCQQCCQFSLVFIYFGHFPSLLSRISFAATSFVALLISLIKI